MIAWALCDIALRYMPQNLTNEKSTLVQVIAWCRQATSRYLSQCQSRFMSPCGITRPKWVVSWWRHQMETFSVLLALCVGNSPVPGEFPTQRPVTRSFDVFFDLHTNKGLSKQWWGWWLETPLCPLWRHCNVNSFFFHHQAIIWTNNNQTLWFI